MIEILIVCVILLIISYFIYYQFKIKVTNSIKEKTKKYYLRRAISTSILMTSSQLDYLLNKIFPKLLKNYEKFNNIYYFKNAIIMADFNEDYSLLDNDLKCIYIFTENNELCNLIKNKITKLLSDFESNNSNYP